MEFYGTPQPSAPPEKPVTRSKYRDALAQMEKGQWYVVASAEQGDRKLLSASISFRKIGAKVAIRTDATGKAHLYVQRGDN